MNKKILIIILGIFILLDSCGKQAVQSNVPDVPFDVSLNLTLPIYDPLNFVLGGIVYFNAGSKGLAILRVSNDEFAVFDRHCPYKVEDGCIVEIDEDDAYGLVDKGCCNSKFSMINAGLPSQGPAEVGLKSYRYTLTGNILRIFN